MQQYTLAILVENSTSVLSQVARLFSRKGYNIESLAVAPTEDESISRITIITRSDEREIKQIVNQLHKVMPVIGVKIMDRKNSVERELMMIKVRVENSEKRDELIQLTGVFRANVVDFSKNSMIISVAGDTGKTSAFLRLLSDFGIIETVRAGTISLERGGLDMMSE
ncbi:MAG: acetolactate synthase small subunit [Firmicutes bacterium]|nr:acetolactate synthase small subunit [Bacillota bacterium]